MRKYSNLVKKIEIFEKLALYGNRSSFLNRLAQVAGLPRGENYTAPSKLNPDSDFITDTEKAKRETFGPATQTPESEFTGPINPADSEFTGPPNPADWPSQPVTPTKPTSVKSKYPAIDKKIQQMLDINPDGSLGPQTQAALDVYKKSIGQPTCTNEQAIATLKNEPGYASGQKLTFDDNSNTYSHQKSPSSAVADKPTDIYEQDPYAPKTANKKLYALLNKYSQMSQEPNASMMPDPEPNMTPNPDAKFGPPAPPAKPAKTVLPTVPTSVQQSLNFLSQEAGTPMNLKLDGQLGTETRKALNWFATANNLIGKSDQELFAAVAKKQQESISKATKQPATQGPSVGSPEMSNIKAPQSRV